MILLNIIFILIHPSISQNLLAHYKFDGNLDDSEGSNDLSATGTGISYGADRDNNPNSALQITQVNGETYAELSPTSFAKLRDSDRTISFWFKTDTEGVVVSVGTIGNLANEQFGILVKNTRIEIYNPTADVDLDSDVSLTNDEWNFIKIIKHMNTISLYVNGVFQTNAEIEENSMDTGNSDDQNIRIGGWNGGNKWFTGMIDELKVYDYAFFPTSSPTPLTNVPTRSPTMITHIPTTGSPTTVTLIPTTSSPTIPTYEPTTGSPTIPTTIPTISPSLSPTIPTIPPTNVPTLTPTTGNPTPQPIPTEQPTFSPNIVPTFPTLKPTYSTFDALVINIGMKICINTSQWIEDNMSEIHVAIQKSVVYCNDTYIIDTDCNIEIFYNDFTCDTTDEGVTLNVELVSKTVTYIQDIRYMIANEREIGNNIEYELINAIQRTFTVLATKIRTVYENPNLDELLKHNNTPPNKKISTRTVLIIIAIIVILLVIGGFIGYQIIFVKHVEQRIQDLNERSESSDEYGNFSDEDIYENNFKLIDHKRFQHKRHNL